MVSKMVSGLTSKNPSGLRQGKRQRETTPRATIQRKRDPPRADQPLPIEAGEASGSSPIQLDHVRPSESTSSSAPATNHPAVSERTSLQQGTSHGKAAATSPRASRPSTSSTTTELMHIFSPAGDSTGNDADYSVGHGLDEAWPGIGDPGHHDALPILQELAASPWAKYDAYFAMPSFDIDNSSEPFAVASSSSAPAIVTDDEEPETDEQQTIRALEEALVNYNEPVLCPRLNDPYDQYLFGHCK